MLLMYTYYIQVVQYNIIILYVCTVADGEADDGDTIIIGTQRKEDMPYRCGERVKAYAARRR